jgi:hypothetical protein
VPGRGVKDRIDQLIERYAAAIGLKGYCVWDDTQILTYLRAYPAVRLSFDSLITSSRAPGWIQHFAGGPAGEPAVLCVLPGRPVVAVARSVWHDVGTIGAGKAVTVGVVPDVDWSLVVSHHVDLDGVRQVADLAERFSVGHDRDSVQAAPRDLLADIAEVLGTEPTPDADVPALLARHFPTWLPYRGPTGKRCVSAWPPTTA